MFCFVLFSLETKKNKKSQNFQTCSVIKNLNTLKKKLEVPKELFLCIVIKDFQGMLSLSGKKKKVFLKKLIFPLKLSFTRQTQSKFGQPTSVHAYSSVYHETRAFCAQKDAAFS